eukprot:TRINITY_DN12683_c0_g1_i1.p1 TRINITY_DN12683_c0_g1~~TRINITY_DN12683_c0_g1_i1.p1  ORF type:complete len:410 (+),score=105.72 TRINITY_DN12683_c0_g1_i1:65-1294(+)
MRRTLVRGAALRSGQFSRGPTHTMQPAAPSMSQQLHPRSSSHLGAGKLDWDKHDFPFARAARARTSAKVDPERDFGEPSGAPPTPGHPFSGSTARAAGPLPRFPRLRPAYPNPKRHKPVLLARPSLNPMGERWKLARRQLPLQERNKKVIITQHFHRPQPGVNKVRHELFTRLKHGLFDLDRILPPLWGPQEESKLDQDEWCFKMLYFLHPIEEDALLSRLERFPHCPFDNRKEMVLALERLVSREYVRRVKGHMLRHPSVDPEEYYWTLMPDETAFGEKLVVEESYLQAIREGKPVENRLFELRKEMYLTDYQQKHNSFLYLDQERSVEELQNFIDFCREEQQQCRDKLEAIGQSTEFPGRDEEEEEVEYPDPPEMMASPHHKGKWHAHGHWKESIPDQRSPPVPMVG